VPSPELPVHIAVDALGGDFGPAAAVAGARRAAAQYGVKITLIGNPVRMRPYLPRDAAARASIAVVEPESAAGAEADSAAAWSKRILAYGHRLLKQGNVDAFVSAGNTGEIFLSAVRHVGRAAGVQRPCIAVSLPTARRDVLLLDAGANPDCRPEYLADFALMGTQYAEVCWERPRPRVYLLSNGTDTDKGTVLVRAAHVLLSALDNLNYQGYAEPYQLAETDDIDVLVTDGFCGNVLIKAMETASRMYADALRTAFATNWRSKLGYGLARPALQRVRTKADPRQHGGAILLGINGVVIVAHGSNDAEAFGSAVRQARDAVAQDVLGRVAHALAPGP